MKNRHITVNETEYKVIFVNIAEKLFEKNLINDAEKVKLINIINRDEAFYKVS